MGLILEALEHVALIWDHIPKKVAAVIDEKAVFFLVLLGFVVLLLRKRQEGAPKETPPAPLSSLDTRDSFNPKQEQKVGDIRTGDVKIDFHLPESFGTAAPPFSPPPAPAVTAEPQLESNLVFVRPAPSRIASRTGAGPEVLTESEDGQDAALLVVANDTAGAGAGPVQGVQAQMVFRDDKGRSA